MNLSEAGSLILGGGGLITACLAFYSARANRTKISSEAGVNAATEKEIEQRAIGLSEKTYQARERFWEERVDKVKIQCEAEIDELREEIGWLRLLIEAHVPWDWEAIRLLKLNSLDMRDPPTLNYIKSLAEQQARDVKR